MPYVPFVYIFINLGGYLYFDIIFKFHRWQSLYALICFTEEDIYIYHEMISQDGEVDELVQRQCQTEWPTEGAENEEGK